MRQLKTLNFEPIVLEKQAAYLDKLVQCDQIASDYSFINLWGWGPEYGLQWAWQDDLVWLKQESPQPALWAPVGDWRSVTWPDLLEKARATADRMIRIPEALSKVMRDSAGGETAFEDSRDHWDYLYAIEDLVALKGNRFHKKKNLLNQFTNTYAFTYLDLGSTMVEQALGMQEDWCTWRDCESSDTLAAENNAIARVLYDWKAFQGIAGGALIVDEIIVAYTIAETMPDGTLLIHFEKACPDHKGSYQAINQQFLAHAPKGPTIVNREQDLGDEGLRKAKLSYHPVDFIRKFALTLG
jgi:uncharacterized protein